MENHEKNIDDLFRDALNDYSETPPPAVWNALEHKLAQTPQPKGYSNRNVWYALLSLLLLQRFGNRAPGYALFGLLLLGSVIAIKVATTSGSGSKKVAFHKNMDTNTTIAANGNTIPANGVATEHSVPVTPSSKITNSATDVKNTTGNTETTANKQETNPVTSAGKKRSAKSTATKINNTINSQPSLTGKKYASQTSGAKTNSEKAEQNVYNSNISNPAPADEQQKETASITDKQTKPTAENKPVATKKDVIKPNGQKPKIKEPYSRFEAGVKIGFEQGFDNDGGKKAVLSPFVQYNLSPKFSIMTQPAYKYSFLSTMRIGNAKIYNKENADSAVQTGISNPLFIVPEGTAYLTKFQYTQTHDSIIKTNNIGGSYSEFEFPLLLKYKLTRGFSVYGGVNIIYSKTIAIKENTTSYNNLKKTVDTEQITYYANPLPLPTSTYITYNGTDISQYHGPEYPTTTSDEWRVGYMLGFSYEFYNRWLFDALIQQANVQPNVQGGYNVNTALSEPYFRFTIGYKLIK